MSAAERIAALEARPTQATTQPAQSFLQDAGQDIKQTGQGLGRAYEETKKKLGEIADAQAAGEQGTGRSILQTAGTIAGGLSSGIGEVFKGAVKTAIPQSWETGIKEGITTGVKSALPVAKSIDSAIGSPIQNAIKSYETASPTSKRDIDALLGAGSLALDVATAGFGKKAGETVAKKGVEVAGELGTKAARTVETIIKEAKPAVKSAAERIKELAYPSPTPLKAVGEVAQGASRDVVPVVKALSSLDTTGVKTFSELGGKIKTKIGELAKQVDADLAINATKKTLGDLNIIEKTKDGLDVITNPVKTALENLTEYYTKIGDNLKLAEVEAIIKKAVTEGVDNVDINNLAREYGRNFNAFNKIGDPLTSVTKQGYELTRSKLKDLARSGLSGDAAKAADDTISALYDTQRLISKSVEDVNKLQQKIRERGLVEKVGHAVTKYADLLTGGSLRGMVAGIMPRGQGYKTLNALDLQDLLQKNLEIIQKAIQTKSDDEIVKIINTMQKRVAPVKVVPPKKEPLLLNAPAKGTPRKSYGSGLVINLPKKTQTTIEKIANKQVVPQGTPKSVSILGTEREYAKGLSQEDKIIETKAFKKLDKEHKQILSDYKDKNGNVVNADGFRPYYKDVGYDGSNAASIQEVVSELGKKAWANGLKNDGEFAVLFAGGSGTGKTSAIKNIKLAKDMVDGSSVVLDGNLSSYKSAISKIKQANESGKIAPILYTYREPIDSMVNGVVKRSINNPDEMGRIVPTKIVAENHIGSWETVNRLNKDGHKVIAIDNSLGAGNQKLVSISDLSEKIKYPSVEELTDIFNKEIKRLYENKIKIGKRAITEKEYQAYIK